LHAPSGAGQQLRWWMCWANHFQKELKGVTKWLQFPQLIMKMSPSSKHQTQNVLCFAILCRNRTVKTSHRRIVLKQKKQLASPHSAAPASHAQKSPPRKSLSGILRTFMRVADCTMPEKQAAHEWNAKLVTARWRGWVFQGDNRSKKNLTDFLFAYLWWFTTRRARIFERKNTK